jgi:deoxyadenosine/deoxycytidine kinase
VKHWQSIQKYEGKEAIMISERSIMSDYNIFAMNSYDCGYMNLAEITIYKQWYDFLTS